MKLSDQFKKMARNAKKRGIPLNDVIPTKQPFRDIFKAEYERYQPRGRGLTRNDVIRSACGGRSYAD